MLNHPSRHRIGLSPVEVAVVDIYRSPNLLPCEHDNTKIFCLYSDDGYVRLATLRPCLFCMRIRPVVLRRYLSVVLPLSSRYQYIHVENRIQLFLVVFEKKWYNVTYILNYRVKMSRLLNQAMNHVIMN